MTAAILKSASVLSAELNGRNCSQCPEKWPPDAADKAEGTLHFLGVGGLHDGDHGCEELSIQKQNGETVT